MALVAKGNNLTDAAHASGYADSAHLSRQFSDLFGVTPGAFAKNSHFLQS
jgi:AraC-like DNA-binding protein